MKVNKIRQEHAPVKAVVGSWLLVGWPLSSCNPLKTEIVDKVQNMPAVIDAGKIKPVVPCRTANNQLLTTKY
jgi:pyruvoyl-dependent arginine decarboxylase (PvlArgDC)